MKKFLSMLLTFTMLVTLAACGASGEQSGSSTPPADTSSQSEENAQPVSSEQLEETTDSTESSADPSAETPVENGGKTLIAYFSWSGNTETLAGMIQEATGGDLFAIETETPYAVSV